MRTPRSPHDSDHARSTGAPAPGGLASGKRTLTEALPPAQAAGRPRSSPTRGGGGPLVAPERGGRPSIDALFGGPGSAGSGGAPLPEDVRAKMERSFGANFSAVRVHESASADQLGALAYARGADLHFAPGHYQPHDARGQELLGHELAHVVQQSQGRVAATTQAKGVALNDDPGLEREADVMGERAARGAPVSAQSAPVSVAPITAAAGAVQRQPIRETPEQGQIPEPGNWYTETRNPGVHMREMRSNDRADAGQYFQIGGTIYRYEDIHEQYVDPKRPDTLWDPVSTKEVKRIRSSPLDFYQAADGTYLSYDHGLYHPIDLYNNFQQQDLLYGQEKQRKWHHTALRDTVAPGHNTTVDQYNKELLGSEPDELSPDTGAYFDFLQHEPGTQAITDPSSGLKHETKIKRSCLAMIEFKTGQGCTIHFETLGVDLASYPSSYTETELRYILENRHFLNMQQIRFYRDGQLIKTTDVIHEHEFLVDEVLSRGRVVGNGPSARIVDTLDVERYDSYSKKLNDSP